LDITLNLNLLSIYNTSYKVDSYESLIENILNRKSTKYDIIIYDNIYTKKFESHFLDLSEHLPQEHLDLYSKSALSQSCISNNRWVALVIFVLYLYLYYYQSLFIILNNIYYK